MPARPAQHELPQARGESVRRRAEERGQEGLAVPARERRESDRGMRGPHRGQGRRVERRPGRGHQHQLAIGEPVDHELQQLHRRGIGPLEILDHQHERTLLEPPLDQPAQGQDDLTLELLGFHVSESLPRLETEDVPEERRDGRRLRFVGAERRQPGRELVPGRVQGIVGRDPVLVAEEGGEDAVRLLPQRGARRLADGHACEAPLALEGGDDFAEQARLADAGLTDEADDLCAAAEHVVEGGQHPAELLVPPDHRGDEAQGLQPARGPGRAADARQPEGLHRATLPLHQDLASRLEQEGVLRQVVCRRADQRLPCLGRALEPGCGVHRVPGDRVGAPHHRAEGSGDHGTRVDADTQGEGSPHARLPAASEGGHAIVHQERGAKGALRIVLVSVGGAERCHDGVADELLDESVVALDRRGQLPKEVVLERADILRVQALSERRETREIGEQDGHQPSIALFTAVARLWRPPGAEQVTRGHRRRRGAEGACCRRRARPGDRGVEPRPAARAEGEVA